MLHTINSTEHLQVNQGVKVLMMMEMRQCSWRPRHLIPQKATESTRRRTLQRRRGKKHQPRKRKEVVSPSKESIQSKSVWTIAKREGTVAAHLRQEDVESRRERRIFPGRLCWKSLKGHEQWTFDDNVYICYTAEFHAAEIHAAEIHEGRASPSSGLFWNRCWIYCISIQNIVYLP